MKILAVETLDVSASVALLEDTEIVQETVLPPQHRSARFLTSAVTDTLASVGWKSRDVQLVALPVGPGSFTGLRVGITFAKIFSYITGAAIAGLNTLHLLAENAPPEFCKVAAAMDAQRGEIITQTYVARPPGSAMPSRMVSADSMRLMDFRTWIETLDGETVITGSVLQKFEKDIPVGVKCVPQEFWRISPAQVGRVARERFLAGERDSVWDILPVYARRSAAEERRMEK